MRAFESFTRWLANGLALIAAAALLLMMLQTAADVFMNNAMGRPIEGNLEIISVYHMVLVVFLPLAMVELRHEHINADLLVRTFAPALQRAVYVFGALVSMAFFGALAWQTWQDAVAAWRIDEVMMGSIYVPIWPAKFALPLGFAAITLATLLHMLQALRDPDFSPTPADPSIDGPPPA
ncbi:TRAP transporter small permease [Orrella sp. JC864]|uniref:TRAP transporter small permease n=1 Tax=Orrella sp. JC864 TaxID=3120298 RepID=UPI0012BCFE7D